MMPKQSKAVPQLIMVHRYADNISCACHYEATLVMHCCIALCTSENLKLTPRSHAIIAILQSKDEQHQQQSQSKKEASPPRLVAVGGHMLYGANVATNSAAAVNVVNGPMATLLAAEAIASRAAANSTSNSGSKSPVRC
jgi:hypothetical protein